MLRFLLTRVVAVAVVLVAVATITWVVLHGLRPEAWASDTRPTLTQLGDYLLRTARLDFGTSWDMQRNAVGGILAEGLPADAWLLLGGLVAGCTGGLVAGAYVAARPQTLLGRALNAVAAVAIIAPPYWVGLVLLLLLADGFGVVQLPFVRTNVYAGPFDDPARFLEALWLPWLVLGMPLGAVVLRMTRASMADVLDEDFLRTARAKGLPDRTVLLRHALPAAASPVLTIVGTQMAPLMTNVVLVENVFSVPGAYQDLTKAMTEGNFPLLQGLTIATAALVVGANLLVDAAQALLDPTVRAS